MSSEISPLVNRDGVEKTQVNRSDSICISTPTRHEFAPHYESYSFDEEYLLFEAHVSYFPGYSLAHIHHWVSSTINEGPTSYFLIEGNLRYLEITRAELYATSWHEDTFLPVTFQVEDDSIEFFLNTFGMIFVRDPIIKVFGEVNPQQMADFIDDNGILGGQEDVFMSYNGLSPGNDICAVSNTPSFQIGELNVIAGTAEILLGTDVSTINLNDWLESVKLGETELPEGAYGVQLLELEPAKVGNQEARIEVIYGNMRKEVLIPVQVLWGHAIVSMDTNRSDETSTIALSLLTLEEKPKLVAAKGIGSDYEQLGSRPVINIFRETDSMQNLILDLSSDPVEQSREALMVNWNQTLNGAEGQLEYGDVARMTVYRADRPDQNYYGSNTWVARDDELKREAETYPDAYYELTPDGYDLLWLNRLNPKEDVEVWLQVTSAELNALAQDFFEFPDDIRDEQKARLSFEFVEYDDTSHSVGDKKGIFKVSEKLQTDASRTFSLQYPVTFTVIKPESIPPLDPLDPDLGNPVNPDNTPVLSDQGWLSFDFISSFNFGTQVISGSEYFARPQVLLDHNHEPLEGEAELRPNYIQISDRRTDAVGWELTVIQLYQFQTKERQQPLMGAQLAF